VICPNCGALLGGTKAAAAVPLRLVTLVFGPCAAAAAAPQPTLYHFRFNAGGVYT
jgi:hypothetical protein